MTIPKSAVDAHTVKFLELRAPGTSQLDQYVVEKALNRQELFPSVIEPQLRSQLRRNVCNIPFLIPTLRTFFENTIYLEPCCHAMKLLLGSMEMETIQECFFAAYKRPEKPVIEHQEGLLSSTKKSSLECEQTTSYMQLWLFVMRHLPDLMSFRCIQALPRKEHKEAKPVFRQENAVIQCQFATLAMNLGFHTSQINELRYRNSDEAQVKRFLFQVRPFSSFDTLAHPVSKILDILSGLSTHQVDFEFSHYTQVQGSDSDDDERLERRCGRPFAKAQEIDRKLLFLPTISTEWASGPHSIGISPLFIRRDFIKSFFGDPQLSDHQERDVSGRAKKVRKTVNAHLLMTAGVTTVVGTEQQGSSLHTASSSITLEQRLSEMQKKIVPGEGTLQAVLVGTDTIYSISTAINVLSDFQSTLKRHGKVLYSDQGRSISGDLVCYARQSTLLYIVSDNQDEILTFCHSLAQRRSGEDMEIL